MYVISYVYIYITNCQVWLKGVAVTQGAPRTYELYSGAIAAPRAFWCEPPTSCPWPRPVLSHWLLASTPVWLDLDWRPGANKLPAAVVLSHWCGDRLILLSLQFPIAVFQWVASYSQFISCMVIWLLCQVSLLGPLLRRIPLPHSNDRGGEEQRFVQTFSL